MDIAKIKDDLISVQEAYIKLLGDEIDILVTFAYYHGWESKLEAEGIELRSQLKALNERLNK